MKGTRHSEEQIIGILKQGEAGLTTAEFCRQHGITEQTYYRWKSKYGGMDSSEAKKLKHVAANVGPQIDSITPSKGQVGGSSAVSISGSGFGTSPTVNVSPAGISVSGVTASGGGTLINALFTVLSSAAVGNYSVTVSVPGGSQPSNSVTFTVTGCAYPTNFQRQSWNPIPSTGELDVTYSWSSSSGNPSDLAACTMSEYVTYPGNPGTYTWPRPPFGQLSANPTTNSQSGANTFSIDKNVPPGSWIKPYIGASFVANHLPIRLSLHELRESGSTRVLHSNPIRYSEFRRHVRVHGDEVERRVSDVKSTSLRGISMRPILGSAFFICLVSLSLTWPFCHAPSACAASAESKSCELVIDALSAATKLKVGMLRAEVEKDFELDGGMSVQDRGTFTYRRCHYIKVNIEFRVHEQNPGTYTFSPEDQVSKISSPYLAYPVSD